MNSRMVLIFIFIGLFLFSSTGFAATMGSCTVDLSSIQALRVDVEDSENCPEDDLIIEGPGQFVSDNTTVSTANCDGYAINISVEGSVERQDANFDYVSINGNVLFHGVDANEGCNMATKSDDITVPLEGSTKFIELSYDTVDNLYHVGAYAEVTDVSLIYDGSLDCTTDSDCDILDDQCNDGFCNSTDKCEQDPKTDGTMCDDEDMCTSNDECSFGSCLGTQQDCSDGVDCTIDSCDPVNGNCINTPDDSNCPSGYYCDANDGCEQNGSCTDDSQCDDGVVCTIDSCDTVTGNCVSTPDDSNCDDGNDCTSDTCDILNGCQYSNKPQGATCGQARDCTSDFCDGSIAEFYPDDGHDFCDGNGNCIVYDCSVQNSYCSDNDPDDGVNGLSCAASCDQDSDCEDECSSNPLVVDKTCENDCTCSSGTTYTCDFSLECLGTSAYSGSGKVCGSDTYYCHYSNTGSWGWSVSLGTESACSDGHDNDCDGNTDCEDSDCSLSCTEDCTNGVDDDADGLIDCEDEECSDCANCGNGFCYGDNCIADSDGDDFIPNGNYADADGKRCLGDCDDSDSDENPGVIWYKDEDGDNYYKDVSECERGSGSLLLWSTDESSFDGGGDCDDTEEKANPGMDEICNDTIDNDCNGLTDCEDSVCSDCTECGDNKYCYKDNCVSDEDKDEYIPSGDYEDSDGKRCLGDCDDTTNKSNPGMDEICNDTIDNDCNNDKDCEDSVCSDCTECGDNKYCYKDACVSDEDKDSFISKGTFGDYNASNPNKSCLGDCNEVVGQIPYWHIELGCSNYNEQVNCDDIDGNSGACSSCGSWERCGICINPGVEENGSSVMCQDGVENNCDGMMDCQYGGCLQAAFNYCGENCSDGIDNNGDGLVDCEDNISCPDCSVCADGFCAEGECVSAGEDATCCSGWSGCDATLPENEICDGLDNDCDNKIDEGLVRDCYTCESEDTEGVGVCRKGKQSCMGGSWGTCVGEITPSEETCNNLDDDCDGGVDEALTQKCYSGPENTRGVGICSPGFGYQKCIDGVWGECMGDVTPEKEICDAKDNDCDGKVDEGWAIGDSCTIGYGACQSQGQYVCDPNNPSGPAKCVSNMSSPSSESCADSIDNDCDGSVNEGCDCTLGETRSCSVTEGVCSQGEQTCVQQAGTGAQTGVWEECSVMPSIEICNGVDDDCDGEVDENIVESYYPSDVDSAEEGKGVCIEGIRKCNNGNWIEYPNELYNYKGDDDSCDGLDNDCDGIKDGTSVGPLRENCGSSGERICGGAGVWSDCINDDGTTSEICDGEDNDGDGDIDEGFPIGDPCIVTLGGCSETGTYVCNGYNDFICSASIEPDIEVCNGKDDDCDGEIDENYACNNTCSDIGYPEDIECGISYGICDGSYTKDCSVTISNDSVEEECTDFKDNDCDGYVDCADSDCDQNPYCLSEICDNGEDDDENGLTDCEDPMCGNCTSCGLGKYCYGGSCVSDEDGDGFIENGEYEDTDGKRCLGDCVDTDKNITPTSTEVCDGIDNNCYGQCINSGGFCFGLKCKDDSDCGNGECVKVDEGFDKDMDGFTICGSWDGSGFLNPAEDDYKDCRDDPNNDPYYCWSDYPFTWWSVLSQDNTVDSLTNALKGLLPSLPYTNYYEINSFINNVFFFKNKIDCSNSTYSACSRCVSPGSNETCFDGIDNNCNGEIDEGCSKYYFVKSSSGNLDKLKNLALEEDEDRRINLLIRRDSVVYFVEPALLFLDGAVDIEKDVTVNVLTDSMKTWLENKVNQWGWEDVVVKKSDIDDLPDPSKQYSGCPNSLVPIHDCDSQYGRGVIH